MKLSKWCILVLVLVVIFPPLHWLSEWHLKRFEYGGIVGLIAAVFYTPHDFRDTVWSGVLYSGETYNIKLEHFYLGYHEIRVISGSKENGEYRFKIDLSCDSGFVKKFDSNRMGTLSSSIRHQHPVNFGGYQVSNFSDFETCQISLISEDYIGPYFVYFRTGYQL